MKNNKNVYTLAKLFCCSRQVSLRFYNTVSIKQRVISITPDDKLILLLTFFASYIQDSLLYFAGQKQNILNILIIPAPLITVYMYFYFFISTASNYYFQFTWWIITFLPVVKTKSSTGSAISCHSIQSISIMVLMPFPPIYSFVVLEVKNHCCKQVFIQLCKS